jgi:murein endopeptidase
MLPAVLSAFILHLPSPAAPGLATVNRHGLVPLPCSLTDLRAARSTYCLLGRNYVTPAVRQATLRVASTFQTHFPGQYITYMDASGPSGHRPFAPHLSHGDGREIDIGLFYQDAQGRPMNAPPTITGYNAYEPPRRGDPVMCGGRPTVQRAADPSPRRNWRLDPVRTKALVEYFVHDPSVRRVFLEPHLKVRLGLQNEDKIRFQGCWAARHDDHLHVDFY